MKIKLQGRQLEFIQVPIRFQKHDIVNLFAKKNNKTLGESLTGKKYERLSRETHDNYPDSLNDKLGEFLYNLKINGDKFYLHFLNKYGDNVFCKFSITKTIPIMAKGVYCFTIGKSIKYIGRSHDTFERRINQGYGRISPKNCYLDGQSTNCRVNSRIAKNYSSISFYVCLLDNDLEIDQLEILLRKLYKPEWNILL